MKTNDENLEKDYLELNRLGEKLHIPIPNLHYELVIKRNGQPDETIKSRSHTWVRNFYNHLYTIYSGLYGAALTGAYGAGSLVMKKRDGTNVTELISVFVGGYVNAAEASAWGLILGTSAADYSFDDYNLVSPITHGTGTGQLSHVAQTVQTPEYTSGTKTFAQRISRIFNNNSSGTITVREMALVMGISGHTVYQMHARDVLASAVTLEPGDQVTAAYISSITYPA